METVFTLAKTSSSPDSIVRSLKEGADYLPHWRFLICEKILRETNLAPDASTARSQILFKEKDPFLRKLLAFQWEGGSGKSRPIEYALRCYRSRNENLTATTISAMVIAGQSPRDIAEEIGTTRANVIAFEKIFFDVRRYLELRPWIKALCFFPSRMTVLEKGASRWLITACEHGWNGLAYVFSTSRSGTEAVDNYNMKSAGKSNSDMISLGLGGRLADFIITLEMEGVKPTAEEMALFCKLGLLGPGLPASFHQLDYPKALSRKEAEIRRKHQSMIGKLTPQGQRRVIGLLERLQLIGVTSSHNTQPNPKPGGEDQSKPSDSPTSAPENAG